MSYTLNAENLTISVPNRGCDKNCPYCVSKMTGSVNSNMELMYRNAHKVYNVARAAGVTSVLFTGKGEPMLNIPVLFNLLKEFNDFPCEVQTNGIQLLGAIRDGENLITLLAENGLNVVAISMDNDAQFEAYKPVIELINSNGMIVRLTVNLTDRLKKYHLPEFAIDYCINSGVRQLTFRHITIPKNCKDSKVGKWIKEHAVRRSDFSNALVNIMHNGRLIRDLNTGVKIYDFGGLSLAISDYCIQDQDFGSNLRSLIFQEDGHLYTSWGSEASILF